MHNNRDENGRFRKGTSGNPNGRPRRSPEEENLTPFEMELRRCLRQKVRIGKDKPVEIIVETEPTKLTIIVKQLVNRACSGDLQALKVILPYIMELSRKERERLLKDLRPLSELTDQELEALAARDRDALYACFEKQQARERKLKEQQQAALEETNPTAR